MTTPAQRVARMGHFVKQWGPDVLPLTSGLAAGDDGKVNSHQIQMNIIIACKVVLADDTSGIIRWFFCVGNKS